MTDLTELVDAHRELKARVTELERRLGQRDTPAHPEDIETAPATPTTRWRRMKAACSSDYRKTEKEPTT